MCIVTRCPIISFNRARHGEGHGRLVSRQVSYRQKREGWSRSHSQARNEEETSESSWKEVEGAEETNMTVTRKNILSDTAVRDAFVQGVLLLKQENSSFDTNDFGISGAVRPVSTYDLFVIWHHQTMMQLTPPGNPAGRNAAHRGPIFLPWHRVMLMLLETNLQRVLEDPNFGLPYWDWAADGDLPAASQPTATIWTPAYIGGSGSPVTNGPFAFSAAASSWRVRIETNIFTGALQSANRGLNRGLANCAAGRCHHFADNGSNRQHTDHDSLRFSKLGYIGSGLSKQN